MQLTLQLLVSAAIILGVLWFMWRLPRRGERYFGWAPPMALFSPWVGLIGVVLSVMLWVLPEPDRWLVMAFLLLDPAAIALGVLVLWVYRGHEGSAETIDMQRTQARVGIALGLVAVAIGYVFVMTQKPPGTVVGM